MLFSTKLKSSLIPTVFSHCEVIHTIIRTLLNFLFDKHNRLSIPSFLIESIISNYNPIFLKIFLELFSATSSFFQYSVENIDAWPLSSRPLEASSMAFAKEKSALYYSSLNSSKNHL